MSEPEEPGALNERGRALQDAGDISGASDLTVAERDLILRCVRAAASGELFPLAVVVARRPTDHVPPDRVARPLPALTIGADGKGERQITDTPGLNGFPKWGRIAVPVKKKKAGA